MTIPVLNTMDRYGAVQKALHWLIALLVLMMLVMGLLMGDIPNGPDKFWVYGIHKSIGISILALMGFRLVWKLINLHRPAPLPTHKPPERMAAALVHWGFYALLIAMPLSGWILTSAANSTINWFGFFPVPHIVAPSHDLHELAEEVHEIMAWGIWAFIALHVAGVIKHVVIDRDATLRRMLPFSKLMVMAVTMAGVMTLALAAGPALAKDDPIPAWTIDRDLSKLTFEATQEGAPFGGAFTVFDGTITMDPAQPETGSAAITIDLGGIDSQNAERDETVKGGDWFDIANTPTATYTIQKFQKSGAVSETGGAYIAIGTLRLRGLERPLDLPFTLTVTEKDKIKTARAAGSTTLKRLDFDVGKGQWADESMVGDTITVRIDLTATAKAE